MTLSVVSSLKVQFSFLFTSGVNVSATLSPIHYLRIYLGVCYAAPTIPVEKPSNLIKITKFET